MNLDFFSLLVLLGACQGFLFSLYLFLPKKDGIKGENYLGFFMLILAYNGFETFRWAANVENLYVNLFFDFFHFMLIFGLGPSVYGYVKSYIQQYGESSRSGYLFTPLFIRIFIRGGIIGYLFLWENGIGFNDLSPARLDNIDVMIAEPLSVVVFCIYLALAFKEFYQWKNNHLSTSATDFTSEEKTNKWLKYFLHCMAVFALIWLGTLLSPMFFEIEYGPHFYLIEVLLVFFVYGIAFLSYFRTRIVYVQPEKPAANYLNSISGEEMTLYSGLIEKVLKNDKLYLDSTLTVNRLAEKSELHPKMVSAVLNGHFRKSFNEYVNEFRIEEVKERLLDPRNAHLTISAIALESGFNSQATFQRVFKGATGVSPKEYIASQSIKST